MSWISTIGDKEGRTDVWTVLISISFILCISIIFLMSINTLSYDREIFDSHITYLYWLTGGFYLDYGINLWLRKKVNNDA